MLETTCNGYKNWDTWNLRVWMDNDYEGYNYIKDNKTMLQALEDKELVKTLKRVTHCTDNINTNKVDVQAIREALEEF